MLSSCAPDGLAVPAPYVAPVVLFLLQIRGVFNDNELNMCDEYQKKTIIYVIIKLQMYVLLYKNKHITNVEGYS